MEVLGRLTGGIAHDLNNLLTVITGCAQILQDQLSQPAAGLAVDIEEAGHRASLLTKQILAFHRRDTPILRSVDVNAIIRDTARLLSRVIGEQISIELELDKSLNPIWAESGMVSQILFNLAVNARDAMPKGGVLTFKTGPGQAPKDLNSDGKCWVRLILADTGTGMTSDVQSRIFQPRFTTKDKGKGTGLGLALVYSLVKALGGWIDFETVLGQGTTFTIDLPTTSQFSRLDASSTLPLTPLVSQQPSDCDNVVARRSTILLVEDDEGVRAVARRLLEIRGAIVLEAESADRALKLSEAHTGAIDLLLSDVLMPGIDGREMYSQLLLTRPELKVVFMSGHIPELVRQVGVDERRIDFLQKPFSRVQFFEAIDRAIDSTVSQSQANHKNQ